MFGWPCEEDQLLYGGRMNLVGDSYSINKEYQGVIPGKLSLDGSVLKVNEVGVDRQDCTVWGRLDLGGD